MIQQNELKSVSLIYLLTNYLTLTLQFGHHPVRRIVGTRHFAGGPAKARGPHSCSGRCAAYGLGRWNRDLCGFRFRSPRRSCWCCGWPNSNYHLQFLFSLRWSNLLFGPRAQNLHLCHLDIGVLHKFGAFDNRLHLAFLWWWFFCPGLLAFPCPVCCPDAASFLPVIPVAVLLLSSSSSSSSSSPRTALHEHFAFAQDKHADGTPRFGLTCDFLISHRRSCF